MDALKAAGGAIGGPDNGTSIDTELVVGDKREDLKVDTELRMGDSTTNNQEQSAEKIDNVFNQTTELSGLEIWLIIIAIVGWMAPEAKLVYREVKHIIGGIFRKIGNLITWRKRG